MASLGLLLVIMSLFGLPWVSEGGQDVSFPDIREIHDEIPAAGLHGTAVRGLFVGSGATPAYGVWLGAAGFAAILVGALMGTRVEQSPRRP